MQAGERDWDDYFAAAALVMAPASGGASRGPGWRALVSGEHSAELNICALLPQAPAGAVGELLEQIGPDLPAVVFRSGAAGSGLTGELERSGFTTAATPEALMACTAPPAPAETAFRIAAAPGRHELDAAIDIASEAHAVERGMLERTVGRAPADAVDLWMAWDGGEPVSVVWLARAGRAIGVMSMMTAPGHQRRGAGRALLTAALAATWSAHSVRALLVATPAGRRLYESIGFAAIDEVTTSFRGVEPALLDAIGQPSG